MRGGGNIEDIFKILRRNNVKKIKVILSVLLMAAAISFTACSNASSGSSDPSTPAPATTPSTPSSGGSGSGSQTPAVTYIGSKAPTVAKAVGDIVFSDGSATPYTPGMSFTDTQKNAAVAIIFYVGNELNNTGDTVRTLGLGLKQNMNSCLWTTNHNLNHSDLYEAIKSEIQTDAEGNVTITGDKNGFDNLAQIGAYLRSISLAADDTATPENYPAFYFAKDYKNVAGSHVSGTVYENGWYLPSLGELYYIYLKGKSATKNFDIDAALQALDGDKFESRTYRSSSLATPGWVRLFSFENAASSSIDTYYSDTYPICAIRDFTTYTVTLNTTEHGTVTANKTSAQAGDSIILTGTGTSTVSNDYKVGSFEINGSTISNVTNNTHTFKMPAANVTVNATFTPIVYKGTKRPAVAKEVGDVVFNDGSSTPYSTNLTQEQKNAVIALIFYKGTELNSDAADGTPDNTTSRTLGVGLKQNTTGLEWCKQETGDPYASIDVTTIRCSVNGSGSVFNITGDKNGSNNLEQISAFLTSDNTSVPDNYPAFYFAKNYKNITGNNVSGTAFENGWYLPSAAELYMIYKKGKSSDRAFDINAIMQDLGGDSFPTSGKTYWSSSQYTANSNSEKASAYTVNFCEPRSGDVCDFTYKGYAQRVCCIREFN